MSLANKVKAGMAYIEITTENSKLQKGLAQAQKSLKNFGVSIQSIGGDLLRLSGMLSIPMALSVKTFASFDDEMRKVQAISRASDVGLQGLTGTARELGAITAFTSKQVAEGMTSLARMGFTAKEVEKSIAEMLYLTRATGNEVASLGEVSMIAGNALRIFKLDASEAGDVCDVLTAASNKSAQSVQDMGETLKTVGPSAAAVNEDLRDVAASAMVLANAGIRGSLAGTALRKAYDALATQSGDAKQQLRDLEIEPLDKNGNLRKMADLMAEIAEKMKEMGTGEKLRFSKDVFDLRGTLAALSLTGSSDDLKRFRTELNNVTGIAKKTADEMEAGIGGAFRMLVSRINEISIALGTAIDKYLTRYISSLNAAAKMTGEWITANEKLVVQFALYIGLATATGAALIALGLTIKLLAHGVGMLIVAFKALGLLFTLFKVAVFAVVLPFKILTLAMTGLVATFTFVAAAIKTTIAALIALKVLITGLSVGLIVVKGVLLSTAAVSTATWLSMLAPVIAYTVVIAGVIAAVVALSASFDGLWSSLKNLGTGFATAFGNIKKVAVESFGVIKDALGAGDLAGAAKVALAALYLMWVEGIKPIKIVWADFKNYLEDAWATAIFNLLEAAYDFKNLFFRIFKALGNDLATAWGAIWDGVADTFALSLAYIKKEWFKTKNMFASGATIKVGLDKIDAETAEGIVKREQASKEAKQKRDAKLAEFDKDSKKQKADIQAAQAEEINKNAEAYNDAVEAATKAVDDAKAGYETAKDFAAQWQTMQSSVKALQAVFDDSAEDYRENKFSSDAGAQAESWYINDQIKRDPTSAANEIRDIIKREKENAAMAKEVFEENMKAAMSDRVIDAKEEAMLTGMAADYGRATELVSYFRNKLSEAGAGTADASSAVKDKALGSWSAKDLNTMLGANSAQERTAKATEEMAKNSKDSKDDARELLRLARLGFVPTYGA